MKLEREGGEEARGSQRERRERESGYRFCFCWTGQFEAMHYTSWRFAKSNQSNYLPMG